MTQNYAYPFASLDTTDFTSLKEIQCIQQVIVSSGSEVAKTNLVFSPMQISQRTVPKSQHTKTYSPWKVEKFNPHTQRNGSAWCGF